jgi:osmotically-inducible protein OsmY
MKETKPYVPEVRSEATLEQRIQSTFERLGYSQLSAIHCSTEGDRIRLHGQLDSFYLKQVAQSVAMKVAGTSQIQNEINVV